MVKKIKALKSSRKRSFYNKLPDEEKLIKIYKVQLCSYFVAEKIEVEPFLGHNYQRVRGEVDITEENDFGDENCDSLKANRICITFNGMLKEMGKLSNFQNVMKSFFC